MKILVPQPPECWSFRCALPHLAKLLNKISHVWWHTSVIPAFMRIMNLAMGPCLKCQKINLRESESRGYFYTETQKRNMGPFLLHKRIRKDLGWMQVKDSCGKKVVNQGERAAGLENIRRVKGHSGPSWPWWSFMVFLFCFCFLGFVLF